MCIKPCIIGVFNVKVNKQFHCSAWYISSNTKKNWGRRQCVVLLINRYFTIGAKAGLTVLEEKLVSTPNMTITKVNIGFNSSFYSLNNQSFLILNHYGNMPFQTGDFLFELKMFVCQPLL